jgi:hypothetical protein
MGRSLWQALCYADLLALAANGQVAAVGLSDYR